MKRTFIYSDEKSNKFWSIEINGDSFTVTYGKVETAGQTQVKNFGSIAECQSAADKLISEKVKKGYVEQAADANATSSYKQSNPNISKTSNKNGLSANIDIVDDGQPKPWNDDQVWKKSLREADAEQDEKYKMERAGAKAITAVKGRKLSDKEIGIIGEELHESSRERKHRKVVECAEKLKNGGVEQQRLQDYFDDSLNTAINSHWDLDENAINTIELMLTEGAKLSSVLQEYVTKYPNFTEQEKHKYHSNLKNRYALFGNFSNSLKEQIIEILKRYIEQGMQPETFRSIVQQYFEEIFTTASEFAEKLIRKVVKTIREGGRKNIPANKLPEDKNGMMAAFIGDGIFIYPDTGYGEWANVNYRLVDDLRESLICKYVVKPMARMFEKLVDEGLFEGITNGRIDLYYRDIKTPLVSRIIDEKAFDEFAKKSFAAIVPFEKAENDDLITTASQLKEAVIPIMNAKLENEKDNRIINIILKYLYSGHEEAEEVAEDILREYYTYSDRWYYEFYRYQYLNFDFEHAANWMKDLVDKGYEPAVKIYSEWCEEGTLSPNKKSQEYPSDEFRGTFTDEDMFVESDRIIARAYYGGRIKIRFKIEGEQGYTEALDFLNNLMEKGYSREFDGLQLDVYFLSKPASDINVEEFFNRSIRYPSLHDRIERYVELVMNDYDRYHDLDGENCTVAGSFAAMALIVEDAKYLPLAIKLAEATDGEHEELVYYFTENVVIRYKVTPESVPAIYELSLTCDHRGPNVPKEVYTKPENLEALLNHFNSSTHHFKDGKLLRFVREMIDENMNSALTKIRKICNKAEDIHSKSIFAEFHNTILEIAEKDRFGSYAKLPEPIVVEAKNDAVTPGMGFGDQSCVMTIKDAQKAGIPILDDCKINGTACCIFSSTEEMNPDVLDFRISNRQKISKLSGAYPTYSVFSDDRAYSFDDKWVIDFAATEYNCGVVIYDGRNKPVVLYGLFDYADVVKKLGKKKLNEPSFLLEARDSCVKFDWADRKGGVYSSNPASKYLANAHHSIFRNKYNRAFINLDKVTPDDGLAYNYALSLRAKLLIMKNAKAQAADIFRELIDRVPQYAELWRKRIELM